MVIDHCCKKVVCCADCVEVTCEVKVDIFHRNYLRISAACCTAFYTEYRSKGWLTKSYHNVLAKLLHCVCQTYCSSGFSFSGRSRVDSGNQNQFAIILICFFQKIVVDFCFVFTILLKIFVLNTCFSCNLSDWFHFTFLCDFDVTFKPHNKSSFRCVRLNGFYMTAS